MHMDDGTKSFGGGVFLTAAREAAGNVFGEASRVGR